VFHRFLRPGQGFRRFTVLSRGGAVAANGRPLTASLTPAGTVAALMMRASHGEIEQWKSRNQFSQEIHPVTHKIIQYGTRFRARPSDVLVFSENGNTRRFLIKGVHNPGELSHFIVYFAEEREDLQ